MAEVEAVPSASTIVLRDAPLEVLMIRRHEQASFVPDTWVFPGGMVDEADGLVGRERYDGSLLTTMRIAAARELFEEAGVWLGAPLQDAEEKRRSLLAGALTFGQLLGESPVDVDQLVWTSHWITPEGLPKRFDTYFFLIRVTREVVATVEQNEAVDLLWIKPEEALARQKDLRMVFPTIRNLEAMTGFASAEELIASRRDVEIRAIQPVLVDGRPTLV